ncbi:hypothetical protein GCM10007414_35870 [Agarivorans gilvus]|uniref:Uncharacterized protein n=1 Tax=Agarivorans gilvus TaxID=680279 RepID=A0ABQ1I6Z4_9ALTE|nr:hypothetical protein GCM10007414_35870 [Agarivorans gilvus]
MIISLWSKGIYQNEKRFGHKYCWLETPYSFEITLISLTLLRFIAGFMLGKALDARLFSVAGVR